MADKFKREIVITGDDRDIQNKLERVNKKLKDVGEQSQRQAKRSAIAFKKFGFALTALVGTMGVALKKAVDTSAKFEFMQTRLVGLYGSVDKARVAFEKFNDVAAKTPFTLDSVVEAGAQLKAFGLEAEETIGVASDLAAFMGLDIVDAANAMGRAFAGGAGAADILRERGVLNLIKSFTGIEDLTKMTLPEFRKAMLETFQDTSVGIAGSSERLSKTWVGMISNMMDAFTRFADSVGDFIIPALKPLVGILVEAAGAAEDFIRSLTETSLETTVRQLKEMGLETETLIELEQIILSQKLEELKLQQEKEFGERRGLELILAEIKNRQQTIKTLALERAELVAKYTDEQVNEARIRKVKIEGLKREIEQKQRIVGAEREASKLRKKLAVLQKESIEAGDDEILAADQLIESKDRQIEAQETAIKKANEEAQVAKDILSIERQREILAKDREKREEEKKGKGEEKKRVKDDELGKYLIIEAFNRRTLDLKNQSMKAALSALDAYYKKQHDMLIKAGVTETEITEQYEQAKKEIRQQYINDAMQAAALGFSNLQTLAEGFGKKGVLLAKRAAQAETLVSTYLAAQKAYESGIKAPIPPPGNIVFGGVLAALATAAGLTRVKLIEAQKFAKGAILEKPVFSPLLKDGALAGEAGREAVIPLDRNDGIFGRIEKQLQSMNKRISKLQPVVNIRSEIEGVQFVEDVIEPAQNELNSRRW